MGVILNFSSGLSKFIEVKLKDPMQDINREIAIMKKLDHPNIIKLYEVLDQTDSDKLFLGKELTLFVC